MRSVRVRAVVLPLLVATVAALIGPVPRAFAADLGVLTYDTVSRSGPGAAFTRSTADHRVLGASVMTDGSLVITDDEQYALPMYLRLAAGARPEPGAAYQLGSGSTGNRITGVCQSPGSGLLQVDAVEYAGTQVTLLAASFGMWCDNGSLTRWFSGSIRIGTTAPAGTVRPRPVAAPATGRSRTSAVTAVFANTGAVGTATLGQAALDPAVPGAADFTITSDRCTGRTLAPGDSCVVDLAFQRSTGGTSSALLAVPDARADGGRLVAPVSGTAVAAPNAPLDVRTYPIRGAVGITWSPPETGWLPAAYHVQREQAGQWADVSGPLPSTDRSFADGTLAAGDMATYRVVGENLDGLGTPSTSVTGTRPERDPQLGAIDAITVDADLGGRQPYPGVVDTVTTDVSARGPADAVNGYWTRGLTGPGVSISLPRLLPGPGTYPVDGEASSAAYGFSVPMSGPSCNTPVGVLTVQEIAFTPTQQLDTLAASYRLACPDGLPVYGELRWRSTVPFAALTLSPPTRDLGRSPVGEQPAPARVSVTNSGSVAQDLGPRRVIGDTAGDWTVVADTCPDSLPAGESCTVDLAARPSVSGAHSVRLSVPDGTARGAHHAQLTVTGTSLPSPATNVRALRLPTGGVDLTWDEPADRGGTGAVRYVVHRHSASGETTTDVDLDPTPSWIDLDAPADATYAVSLVNEIGEGAAGTPVTPTTSPESLYVTSAPGFGSSYRLGVIASPGGSQAVPTAPRGEQTGTTWGLAISPDGRSLLTTQSAAGGYVLWREAVDRSTPPVKLWSNPQRLGRPAWSPDGTRIAVAGKDPISGRDMLHILPAAGGAPTLVVPGLDMPAWMPDSRTLLARDTTLQVPPLVRVDASTGTRLGNLAGADGAELPTVSPDGRWVAFRRYTGGPAGTFLLPVGGGTAQQVTGLAAVSDLSWRPDGRTLALVLKPPYGTWGISLVDVDRSGVAGELTPLTLRRFTLIDLVAWAGARVSLAPSPALTGPVASFTLDASALPAGSMLTCAVDDGAAVACGSEYRSPALASGPHILRVTSVQPGGRVTVAARAFATDATAPAVWLTSPTVAVTTAATATASYAATDTAGVASYDLRYRRAGTNGVFGGYTQPVSGTRATSAQVALAAGYQSCISVRARDTLGNVSGWSAERCVSRPLDDRSLGAATTGWTRSTSSAFYLGTATWTTRTGAALAISGARARQVYVLATTCSTCGSLAVYLGATRVGSISLYAAQTHNQALVALPATASLAGTLKLVTTSPTGRLVRIDGVALRAG